MIYFDNASTTKTLVAVNEVMQKALEESYFNPSSLHTPGFKVRQKVEMARKHMLHLLNASDYNMVFTGSATEANNLALAQVRRGKVVIGGGEHPSVLETAKNLEAKGFIVEYVKLNNSGMVDENDLKEALTPDVSLVSVQLVSNETGAINNIKELVRITRRYAPRALFHSDMVQAVGKIDVDISYLGVDMASISAHKLHGPKGIGALIYKKSLKPIPLVFGGGQEMGIRSGTENVPQILAFETALEHCIKDREEAFNHAKHIKSKLLDMFINSGLTFKVHGLGSPFILSVSFDGIRGESLMHALEEDQILIATGSACSSKKVGNTTLESMGLKKKEILGNVRISFGHEMVPDQDIEKAARCIITNVKKLKD